MTSTVELGDVYVCVFPFTSGQAAKARPVLVLMDLGPDCLVCRITSVPHRGFLDLPVTNWHEAGLEKPSTIRLSRLVTVEKAHPQAPYWKVALRGFRSREITLELQVPLVSDRRTTG